MGGMGKGTAHAVEGVPALGICCDEQEVGVFGHVCSFWAVMCWSGRVGNG